MKEQDENNLFEVRKEKLNKLREQGQDYPNSFRRNELAKELIKEFSDSSKDDLESKSISVKVAGRIMLRRLMGKASFTTIQDMSAQIQLYLREDTLSNYDDFKTWDIGDIIGVEGDLFKTNTGELSIKVTEAVLLTKSLKPLPEKHQGLVDVEQRYRKRYLDLLVNEESREVFLARSKIISETRSYFDSSGFIEVETPMMHPIPGGAAAKPFVTHHNALGMDLYLRIAPELYLKRLVVGGFEKVYEINRNFRNEGLSTKHNPEFTMLEFYTAYEDYEFQMDFVEALIKHLSNLEQSKRSFKKFKRVSFDDALTKNTSLNKKDLDDIDSLRKFAQSLKIENFKTLSVGKLKAEIFESEVEDMLSEPTFIYKYPLEISPLSRKSEGDEGYVDRFELFIDGKEIANGFSELNDPEDQLERFKMQMEDKEKGDEEAMEMDLDYIEALEYGLAPCAGVGIGLDRLVMLLTGIDSIRDVILFPQLKNKGN
ncbi:MAG: lysine--tRNA ligase [Acidimicrobiaceae bacterium TMED210]|nr:MAG: lysine--tRNA ligase [Acidimicrobiaceae bacterium TMED210]